VSANAITNLFIVKMPPPLFTVESESCGQKKSTVNLLPCRIHHDGDVTPSDIFWNPTKTSGKQPDRYAKLRRSSNMNICNLDNTQTAYFRGRKLKGKAMKLPEGYYGTVVKKTEIKPETSTRLEATEEVEVVENPEDEVQIGAMKGKATFDELMVWGHESTTDSTVDPYVRGMEEWIAFAEQVRTGYVILYYPLLVLTSVLHVYRSTQIN